MRVFLCVLCVASCALWSGLVFAQSPVDPSEIAFRQALKDMSNDLRLMCVAAHPDDEDGATLAYYRYKHGVKTFALIGTRGEGGQNEIGPELYEDLAVIRTKEMMAAAEIEGAELHFLDMPEFGFSKTIEETFEKWGKDVLLEKMVRKIRLLRPHVIITHHGRMKDHGHHQAIGWAVQEAFTVAADATAFPEAGEPWQVQRLFIRDFSQQSTEAVVINISETDELRGKKYTEIAADALRAHKSQGMEQFINMLLTGEPKAYYDLVKEAENKGLLTTGEEAGPLFQGVKHNLRDTDYSSDTRSRAKLLPELKQRALALDAATASGPADQVMDEMFLSLYAMEAVKQCMEISTTWTVSDPVVVPGQLVRVQVEHRDGGTPDAAEVKDDLWLGGNRVVENRPRFDESGVAASTLEFEATTLTLPQGRHVFERQPTRPVATLRSTFLKGSSIWGGQAQGIDFNVAPPVLPEFVDAPCLQLPYRLVPEVFIKVRLTNFTPGVHEQDVRFRAPEGWGIAIRSVDEGNGPDRYENKNKAAYPVGTSISFAPSSPSNSLDYAAKFSKENEQLTLTMILTTPEGLAQGDYSITAETDGLEFTPELKVKYLGIRVPLEFLWGYTSVYAGIAKRVGIIDSYDTTFGDTMVKMKVNCFPIRETYLTPEQLANFNVIIIDMRSYLYRPDLKANNAVLLDWCKRGGTLIVNYHKTFDWSPDFAPYPLSLSSNRVTREDAPVKLLVPEHPWFNTPNKITPEDWDGWRQERGLYFAGKWDDAYTPLIDTSDPGETIPPGSCLIADYGEGTYFYTSLVWYRQLRELHPGALKLFANMLAL